MIRRMIRLAIVPRRMALTSPHIFAIKYKCRRRIIRGAPVGAGAEARVGCCSYLIKNDVHPVSPLISPSRFYFFGLERRRLSIFAKKTKPAADPFGRGLGYVPDRLPPIFRATFRAFDAIRKSAVGVAVSANMNQGHFFDSLRYV